MPDDLADLADLRRQLEDLRRLIFDSRTPSGVRKRATRGFCDVALQAIDLAAHKLAQRQAAPVREDDIV